jgi:hypothetical protein
MFQTLNALTLNTQSSKLKLQMFKHTKKAYIKSTETFGATSTKLQCDKNKTMGQRMKQQAWKP